MPETSVAGLPRLAVTGSALVSPAGSRIQDLWRALDEQRSCVAEEPRRQRGDGLPPTIGLCPPLGDESAADETSHAVLLARRAASDAWRQATDEAQLDASPDEVACYLGTALGAVDEREQTGDVDATVFASLPRRIAGSFASGPHAVFSVTCVSGLCALEQATADLAFGRARAAVVGSFDSISECMLSGFTALRAVSPSGVWRPFAADRDGIVIGEAAAFAVVEPFENVTERGVVPRAVILGQSLISDGYHMTTPEPTGKAMETAIREALAVAQLQPSDLGAILVTAVGSPVYDLMLARAIHRALGDCGRTIPVSTWESAIGHILAANGTAAIAVSAEMIARRLIPSVYPLEDIDEECELAIVRSQPADLKRPVVLSLIVGFGGQNGAVVVGAPSEGKV